MSQPQNDYSVTISSQQPENERCDNIVTRVDDIVTRLRIDTPTGKLCNEAAREIERLRAERGTWEKRTTQLLRYLAKQQGEPPQGCRCVCCKIRREVEKQSD